jgi:hypothetical protein
MSERVLLSTMAGMLLPTIATGCGGDTDGLSKARYVSKLDAMCREFSAREGQTGEPHSSGDLIDKEPQILDAFEKTIADKVGDLHAPPEIAAQADRLGEIADQRRDVLAGLVAAAKKGDLAKVQRLLARNAALNMQSSTIAHQLGANACS